MFELSWKKFYSLPILLTLFIVSFDQWTKYRIVNSEFLGFGGKIEIIPNIFHIVFVTNSGAAWGLFSDHTQILAAISAIVLFVLIVFFGKITSNFNERCIAITLMLGGIAGNLIDRVFRKCVIDFLSFTYKSFEWPAFNIADSAICIGVAIFSISSFLRPEEDQLSP